MFLIQFFNYVSFFFIYIYILFSSFFKLDISIFKNESFFLKYKFYKEIFIYKYIYNFFNFFFFYFIIYYKINLKKINSFFFFLEKKELKQIFFKLKDFLQVFYLFIYFILIFLFFTLFFLVFSSMIEIIPLTKLFCFWGTIGFFAYIFISGFIYFGKRYNYNRYTDALQRFWKRSFSIFWLLEGFIFVAFIFLTFNCSSEIVYSYDPQYFFKLHIFSWKIFFFKLIYIKIILISLYILNFLTKKNNIITYYFCLFISTIVTYIFFIEFCQFLQFLSHSTYFFWTYNSIISESSLEFDLKKTRIVNNYILICSIAKFWHVVFIVFIWFFNYNRFFESQTTREYLLATNLQNFLILYLLNWICMYPWFKLVFRNYLGCSYYYFFLELKDSFYVDFLNSTVFFFNSFLIF